MVKAMPAPYKHKRTGVYQYRQRTPRDILEDARGKKVSVTVDGTVRQLTIGGELKVSLSTKDPREAKERAREVQDQYDLIWDSFRSNEITLTHRQAVALAGEVYRDWSVLEDNPGSPELWSHIRALNADALIGRPHLHLLTIRPVVVDPLEDRFGPFVDVVLERHHLRVTPESRMALLNQVAIAVQEVSGLLERRAKGDYRPDTNADRFPSFEPPKSSVEFRPSTAITFHQIIDAEAEHRRLGLGAKYQPLATRTQRQYKTYTTEFAVFRGDDGDRADTVTHAELKAWKVSLLTDPERPNGPRTVNDKVGSIKTMLGWGVERFPESSGLKRALAAVGPLELPGFTRKPSDISAIRLDEAAHVLRAARRETDSRTRWLPWLCAYTGARINELTPLERKDFFETEGYWFFKIRTTDTRSVKNANAIRYVPVHSALQAEGFRAFVEGSPRGRLFGPNADSYVGRWFRHENGAGITREGVSPNHGWRHLFEDLCRRYRVSDSAARYITGRSGGGSSEEYGKTFAMLPGLAQEIERIEPFIID
ncbi:DUF6538 domain-containing protein [Pelagibacterium sediminicola]|uniref:DUF6538 domain-containing protein n=1 Tax=Pelagibacterium sediminicola TaxID=2248761 RepID=UPI000E31E9B4|nr:DUF6538 domain-containing protein [Pelagibacterium sediminicola]